MPTTVYPSFKVIAECQYLCSNFQSVKNHGSITELALIEILHLNCKQTCDMSGPVGQAVL